jgi:hypothetical protein
MPRVFHRRSGLDKLLPFRPLLASGLETRWLYALPCEKAIDGVPMNTQHATDTNCIETAVVNQTADRLRVDAELVRNLTNAHESRISAA